MDTINELTVTFYPELYLQRRVWILNFLRKHGIARVLDVGCGEGALISTLCQPAPWLTPPTTTVLPASPTSSLFSCSPTKTITEGPSSPGPGYTYKEDDIPNLHVKEVHGLDISDEDLVFAIQAASPPERKEEDTSEVGSRLRALTGGQRWEALTSKMWKGGLEVINDEFKNMECIVGMEVIEHLPESTLKAFGPVLLGIYHPEYLLVTTPSYTFNARFTAPDAPSSARTGYRDPTGRTDRVFRHSDHKFEWTREEFQTWCQDTAKEWGYEVNETTIGHGLEPDPWDRDDELQGATQVAAFYRVDLLSNQEREMKARRMLKKLDIKSKNHECLAAYHHPANPAAMQPKPLEEIAKKVKEKMEDYRLTFMRMEELWFESDIGSMCGGWIEVLVRAVEESVDLNLKCDVDGVKKKRSMWSVELVGGISSSWDSEGESIDEDIPEDWIPGETPYSLTFGGVLKDDDDLDISTGDDGDVSGGEGDDEWEIERHGGWGTFTVPNEKTIDPTWGQAEEGWNHGVPLSAVSSTTGWDGDESEDTS